MVDTSYIVIVRNIEGEIDQDQSRIFVYLESAIRFLKTWAEENAISTDPDDTEAYLYFSEDQETYFNNSEESFICRIDDDNTGSC